MSNLIDVSDYSQLEVVNKDNPTPKELSDAILVSVQQLMTLKDDKGEPRNEEAMQFLVMVPIGMMASAQSAVRATTLDTGSGTVDNPLHHSEWKVQVAPNARLSWTSDFCTFRTDARMKSLIRQSETEVDLKILAEGSDLEYNENKWSFGIDASRNVGSGMYWQTVKSKFSTAA